LRLGAPLVATGAVDVEVREDPEQPGAQVRAGRERAPAAEGALIGLLDEVLGLLAGVDEPARDPEDLIGELERLLLEAHAVARLVGDAAPLGVDVGHQPPRAGKPASDRTVTSSSRDVLASSHVSVTSPMRLAEAASRPSCPWSAVPSLSTHCSQRHPFTWIVSVSLRAQ